MATLGVPAVVSRIKRWIVADTSDGGQGVAAVPGSSFYSEAARGRGLVRFAFCKRIETLRAAGERLRLIARAGG